MHMKIIFGIRFPTILIKDDKMQFLLSLVMWCCLYGIFSSMPFLELIINSLYNSTIRVKFETYKLPYLISIFVYSITGMLITGIFIQNASFSGVLTLLIMGSIFTTPVVYIICVYVFNDKDKKKIINQKISERKRQINEMLIM